MIVEETDPGLEFAGYDEGGGSLYNFNGIPFTGVIIFRHPSGIIFQEISHVDGYENGLIREYDTYGNLRLEFHVKLNIQYGVRTEWDENGKVLYSSNYGPEP